MERLNNLFANASVGARRSTGFFAIFIAIFAVSIGMVLPASAQSAYQVPNRTELDQFRKELGQTIEEMYQHRETLRQSRVMRLAQDRYSKSNPVTTAAYARQEIQDMSYEDLAVLHKALNTRFAEWRAASDLLGKIAAKVRPTEPGTSNSTTPDSCSDAYLADPSFTDWAYAKGFEIGGQAVYEGIPEPINIPAIAIWVPLAEAAHALETLNAIYDRCSGDDAITEVKAKIDTVETRVNEARGQIEENDDDNTAAIIASLGTGTTTITTAVTAAQTAIITNDNSNALALNTNINNSRTAIIANNNTNTTNVVNNANTNTTNIINNDNANRTLIINNANANTAALTDLMLRTQIEADLAEADNATFVGWYVMPTASGGHFDFARSIVVETIAALAGANTARANECLAESDAFRAAGNYKAAYRSLRKAYKAAVGN